MKKRKVALLLAMTIGITSVHTTNAITLEETESSSEETAETSVYAVVASDFTVTLPKNIKLDSKTMESDYTVTVSGDIPGKGIIDVVPDATFAMKQANKSDAMATVTQEKTSFSCAELTAEGKNGVTADGNVSVFGLTPGHWEGIFNFNVTTTNMPGTDPAKLGLSDYDTDMDVVKHTVTLNKYKGKNPIVAVKAAYTDADGVAYQTIVNSRSCFTGNGSITDISFEKGVQFANSSAASLLTRCASLKTVDMHDVDMSSVTDTSWMFNQSNNITSINMSGVKLPRVYYTRGMFQYCDSVVDFTPPEEMRTIDNFCFNHLGKWNATSVTIPKGVKKIGDSHIYYDVGTDAFKEFKQQEESDVYKVEDGILYSADRTTLFSVPKGKEFPDKTWEMPEGITKMNTLSFSRVTNMDKVILPNSYVIADDASDEAGNYGNSLHLATYHIATIHKYGVKEDNPNYVAQNNCLYSKDKTDLIAVPIRYQGVVDIPEGTTKIHKHAFYTQGPSFMDGITGINIPASVTNISAEQITTINYMVDGRKIAVTVADGNTKYTVTDGYLKAK